MKVAFEELFTKNRDGTLTPRFDIRIGSVMLSPGITFNDSVLFAGINLFDYLDYDLDVDFIDGAYVVKGFYE